MNPAALIRTVISLVVMGALGAFMYIGPGRSWLTSAADEAQEVADDAAGKAERDADGNVADGGRIEGSSLQAGDCLMAADLGTTFHNVEVKPCTEAHDAQVVGEWSVGPGSPEPTETEMFDGCTTKAATYVGPRLEPLGVSIGVIAVEETVSTRILCLVETDDGQPTLTQSLEGQGI